MDETGLQRMLDEASIRNVMSRYARGVDRREWDLVRAAFHPDARDDHGAFRGGIDGLIDWVSRRHAHIEQSMHFLGNCLIEFNGPDKALVETYYAAYLRLGPAAQESRAMLRVDPADFASRHVDTTVLGRYIDRFEKRAGEWKIGRRVALYEAIRSGAIPTPDYDPQHDWARRDRSDKLFEMRRDVFDS